MALEEEPPFNVGDVQAGFEGLARAVAWLTGTVKEERSARRSFETQMTEALAKIATAEPEPVKPPPLTPMAKSADASGQGRMIHSPDRPSTPQGNAILIGGLSGDVETLRNSLLELQAFVRYLEDNIGNWRKQQEQSKIVAEALLQKELETLRAGVDEELSSLEESVTDKVAAEVKAAVEKEPRGLAHRRTVSNLADKDISSRLDATCKALTERLNLIDDRVNGLARPSLITPNSLSNPSLDAIPESALGEGAVSEGDALAGAPGAANGSAAAPGAFGDSAAAPGAFGGSAAAPGAFGGSAAAPGAAGGSAGQSLPEGALAAAQSAPGGASLAQPGPAQSGLGQSGPAWSGQAAAFGPGGQPGQPLSMAEMAAAAAPGSIEEALLRAMQQATAETMREMLNMQNRVNAMEAECKRLGAQAELPLDQPGAVSFRREQALNSAGTAGSGLEAGQSSADEEGAMPEAAEGEEQAGDGTTASASSKTVVRPAMSRIGRSKTSNEGGLNLGNIRRQSSTNSSDRRRSSSSEASRGKVMTPSNPRELRTELMRYMELQMQEFREATKEGTEDAVATATGQLREELMGYLSTEITKVAPSSAAASDAGRAASAASAAPAAADTSSSQNERRGSKQAAASRAAASRGRASVARGDEGAGNIGPLQAKMEDAVSAAANELRRDIGAWLEEQLSAIRELASASGSRPLSPTVADMAEEGQPSSGAAGSRAAATPSTAATAKSERGRPTSIAEAATAAEKGTQADVRRQESKERNLAELGATTVAQAAKQIKSEIGAWLEEQLQALRAEKAPAPSAPGSRGSGGGVGRTAAADGTGRPDFDDRASEASSAIMPGHFVSQYAGDPAKMEDVVKWFESQMNELGSTLSKARKEAVSKATTTIRDEVKSWWEGEMGEFHRSVSKARASLKPMAQGDAQEGVKAFTSQLNAVQESPAEWLGGRFTELVEALSTDEDLVNKVLDKVREELDGIGMETAGAEGAATSKVETQSNGSRSSPRQRRSLIVREQMKASSSAIQELEERVRTLEDNASKGNVKVLGPVPDLPAVEDVQAAAAAAEGPPDFMSMMEVQDTLRRLSTRFEYLERVLPPDVQKAMNFFEPLNASADMGADLGPTSPSIATQMMSSAGIMRRINELQAGQSNVSDEAKVMSEDARREVVNLSRALKGTQRDSEVNASKIDDLQRALAKVKTRFEAALPQVLQVVEELHRPAAGAAPAAGSEGAVAADVNPNVEGLRALLRESSNEGKTEVDAPHPFVSQNGLRRALDAMQGDVQAWLNKLREDLIAALQGKADSDTLRRAIEDLTNQVQTPQHVFLPPEVASAEGSAAMRFPVAQGRCLTCDTKVELRIDDPRAFKVKTVPSPAFPQSFRHVPPSLAPPPNSRPQMPPNFGSTHGSSMGGSMKRVESLPAINRP